MTDKAIDLTNTFEGQSLVILAQLESAGIISTGQAAALIILKRLGTATAEKVGKVLRKPPHNISKMLEKIERKGVVKSDRSSRPYRFTLTDKGESLVTYDTKQVMPRDR